MSFLEVRTEKCWVTGSFRHETEDLFPEYDDAIISVWRDLIEIGVARTYKHESCFVSVNYDFRDLLPMLENRRDSMLALLRDPGNAPDDWWKLFFEPVRCSFDVSVSGSSRVSRHGWYAAFFAESYLYDLFLILNISLPGSANFLSAKVSSFDENFHEDLRLSSFYLEEAWISSSKGTWPKLTNLPVDMVIDWFFKVRPGFSQVPESSIERSIFSLLHICQSEGRPEDILWLFYAFESLFKTRPGENFNALFERFCLLLDPPDEARFRLKKELRKLYDFRSSFVHGGLKVIHPHHRELMDDRVDKQYGDVVSLSLRWTHILVACLQKLVLSGWTDLTFESSIVAK